MNFIFLDLINMNFIFLEYNFFVFIDKENENLIIVL